MKNESVTSPSSHSRPPHSRARGIVPRHWFTHLRGSGLLQTIARGVLVTWLAPIVVAMLAVATLSVAPQAVQAQAAPQRVIVLDFAVGQGLDPILGRKAADSLAVELQNSRNYQVITRQEIESFITKNPGFTPPFDEATQARLGQGLNARSIFSGRVVSANVVDHRSSRVQVEVRQLDVTTADYVNGAQVTEATSDKLAAVDNDILVDEAINKAASTALRQIRQTPVPVGVVQNVTRYDVELNIGARNGVSTGQHYAVLRDQLNKALSSPGNEVVDRVKIAEIQIDKVEADQAIAHVVAGISGVNTGDRVRRIFLANAPFPISPSRGGGASNLPPVPRQSRSEGGGSGGLLGVLGGVALLALLVVGGGFGGGGGGGTQADVSPPRNVVAVPISNIRGNASINVNFSRGIPSILAGQAVAGYLIFRGTSPSFSADATNLQDFVRGGQTSYVDNATTFVTETVTVSSSQTLANGLSSVTVTTAAATGPGNNSLTIANTGTNTTGSTITAVFTRQPTVAGTQYFYQVRRVTLVANPTVSATPTTTGGNNNNNDAFIPALSNASPASGGATAIPAPTVSSTSNDLNNFSVVVAAVPTPGTAVGVGNAYLFPDVNQFVVQVSTSPSFELANRFEQTFATPALDANGNLNFNLGSIRVPGFEAGQPVYVRVGARDSADSPGPGPDPITRLAYIFGPTLTVTAPTASLRASSSRFISASATGRSSRGTGLPGASSEGGLRAGGFIRRPASISRH